MIGAAARGAAAATRRAPRARRRRPPTAPSRDRCTSCRRTDALLRCAPPRARGAASTTHLLAVLCVLSVRTVAYTGDTRKQAVARELQESLAPPLLNATLPRRSLLFQLERQSTERWNHSRRVLLLGKKARRDFRVYDWAFRVHHFDVHHSTSAVGVGDYDTQQAGAVLCHSIYTSNCLKLPKQAGAVGAGDYSRIFTMLLPSQKINRFSGVRQVLTTKDGLCDTLRQANLGARGLWRFTFPCYKLPDDGATLGALVNAGAGAGAGASGGAGPGSWIVKPPRGSQGSGIRVLSGAAMGEYIRSDGWNEFGRDKGVKGAIVQPYLDAPLLSRGGRKWDVRSYVLCTSVAPLRLYLFTEGIVRYASALYAADATDSASVLTNTAVGKKVLRTGVSPITGTLAELAAQLSGDGVMSPAELLTAMRETVGRLFLTVEAGFERYYARLYGGAADGDGFRCRGCYHLFGVDLIADASAQLHVIEVNVEPDLTISSGRAGSSETYDHTKYAAAFSTVRLVYSSRSSAAAVASLVAAHERRAGGARAVAARYPSLYDGAATAAPTLRAHVLGYLLDAVREGRALGCYVSVYPSAATRDTFGAHLAELDEAAAAAPAAAGDAGNAAYDFAARRALHGFLHEVLRPEATTENGGGGGGARDKAWRRSYREQCEGTLRTVAAREPKPSTPGLADPGAWARRTTILGRC